MSGPAVASVVSVASFVSVVIGGAVVSPSSCMQPIKLMFSFDVCSQHNDIRQVN